LFRKVGNKSSQAYPDVNNVRTNASYIYEVLALLATITLQEFVTTDSLQDVKMYTIGPHYVHAESRKSPVVDGKVERDKDGKEIRYTVTLTKEEHEIARKIVRCFHQGVSTISIFK
jgi:inositol hexakisphosphate/diphosphoinositol-pentakisphosphate kinase